MSAKRASISLSSHKMNQSNSMMKSSIGNRHNYRGSRAAVIAGSISRKNIHGEEKHNKPIKANVKVFDDQGCDVTPRSLLNISRTDLKQNQSLANIGMNESTSVGAMSDMIGHSIYDTSNMQASYAQGFSRSMCGSVMGSMSRLSVESMTEESVIDHHISVTQDFENSKAVVQCFLKTAGKWKVEMIRPTRTMVVSRKPVVDDAHILLYIESKTTDQRPVEHFNDDSRVTLTLQETDTIWHFDIVGTSTSTESEDAQSTIDRNAKYDKLIQQRIGNDMYVHGEMQTFNNASKTKGTQASIASTQDVGCLATTWDMYDSFNNVPLLNDTSEDGTSNKPLDNTNTMQSSTMTKESRPMSAMTATSIGSFMTSSDAAESSVSGTGSVERDGARMAKLLETPEMRTSLFTMERVIMQNIFHEKQATYRGCPESTENQSEKGEESNVDLGPSLQRLWIHSCTSTKGKHANCIAWNKSNKDIAAVGYGTIGSRTNDSGLVCCWSLKNPECPERMFSMPSPVTSIDFSRIHPNLIAVGLYNGTIVVNDVRQTTDVCGSDTRQSPGKHYGPIWQLEWVNKGTGDERDEVLVSVSSDGRVTQWSIRKGFEHLDLMKLKRASEATPQQPKTASSKSDKKNDALISRYSSGMCLNFHPQDNNVYIVGTEDGHIHRCSCSYNEQVLETYSGHSGAIYNVKWSPFRHNAFLSCSSDWTLRLWHQDKKAACLTLRSTMKRSAVVDFDWSPNSSTVFAAIDEKQIEIWDLNVNTLDPVISFTPIHENRLTAISFSRVAPAIFVGDSEGNVAVYLLRNFESSLSHGADILDKTMATSQLPVAPPETETAWELDDDETADR